MAKVIHVGKPGGVQHLSIEEVDVPEPGPGEVRFRVSAFALNRADILYIDGEHYTELKLPSRVGSGLVSGTSWRLQRCDHAAAHPSRLRGRRADGQPRLVSRA